MKEYKCLLYEAVFLWISRKISWHGVGGHRRSADIWRLGSSGKASEERWLPSWILKESLDVDLRRMSITDTRHHAVCKRARSLDTFIGSSQPPSGTGESDSVSRWVSRQTLCNPTDCSPPGSSVHAIPQARIVEGVAIPFSRGSSWPGDWTQVPWTAGRFFTVWALRDHKMT